MDMLDEAESRADEAESRVNEAESRADEAEIRAKEANTNSDILRQQLIDAGLTPKV